MNNDEWDLLQRFVRTRSDDAFAELVRRYVRLVYGRCLRQLGDPHAAEDVTQGVFLVLAGKAGRLSPDVSLAAWLYRVAGLACRNEVKVRARRRRHEAAAAAERARTADAPADVAGLVPLLDAAVDRLGAADRRAVLMRYFEGRTVGEVAAALGVAENTAGRRLLRATAKLRATFAAGGVTVPAAGVGAAVAAVVAATASPAGATSTTPAAKSVARSATRSLRWAAWEPAVAAAVVAVAVVASGVAVVVTRPGPVARVVPVVAVLTVVDRPESQVPGETQLAQWNVLLSEAGYRSVADVGRPVASASRVYGARLCDAAALRRGVAAAVATGGVAAVEMQSRNVELPQPVRNGKRYSPQLTIQDEPSGTGRYASFFSFSKMRGDTFDRRADGGVALHLDDPDLGGGVAEGPRQDGARPAGGSGIVFDGSVAPGQTVAFVGRFVGRSGAAYYHLMAWEAYRATPIQSALMGFPTDARWWCQHGPEPLRLWADGARVWSAEAAGWRPYGPPSLSRTLPDGELVWLMALCRPAEHPWCWWDPTGGPAAATSGGPMAAGPPAGLWAEVQVSPPLDQLSHPPPAVDNEQWGERDDWIFRADDHRVDDENAKPLQIGVPMGAWAEVGRLRYGQPVTAGGVRYEITVDPGNAYWPRLRRRGVLDDQFHLVGVHPDGTTDSPFTVGRELMWGEPGVDRDLTTGVYGGGLAGTIEHFSLRVRKRAFVTFDGFTTRPSTRPPPGLTRPEVDADLARIADEHLQRGVDAWGRERLTHVPEGPARNVDWNDGMRLFRHAAVTLDEAAVRRLLSADDPRAVAALDRLAHLVAAGEAIRTAAAGRFGEPAAHDLLDRPGLFEDLQGELAGVGWTGTLGSRYHVHPYTDMASGDPWLPPVLWRQEADGAYTLDVDGLFADAGAVDRLANRCRLADDVRRAVAGGHPTASLDDVRRRLVRGG